MPFKCFEPEAKKFQNYITLNLKEETLLDMIKGYQIGSTNSQFKKRKLI